MKKRNQLLETNKIAKMLEERRQKQIDQFYVTAVSASASAAYASTSVSAYASAYTYASASASASAYAYANANAWRQIARSGPDQAVLYYNWMTWEVKRGEEGLK